jgi:hypothetical protein
VTFIPAILAHHKLRHIATLRKDAGGLHDQSLFRQCADHRKYLRRIGNVIKTTETLVKTTQTVIESKRSPYFDRRRFPWYCAVAEI